MAQLINLVNQKIDYVTVLQQAESRNKHVYWLCQCECGKEVEFSSETLLRKNRTRPLHCGCKTKKKTDLIDKRFGRLLVIEKTDKRKNNAVIWKCKCDCGKIIETTTSQLTSKHIQSCGCLFKEAHRIDIANQRFGKLVVKKIDDNNGKKWICECDCGNICSIDGYNLRSGITNSCGCINYSLGEERIIKILKQENINYIKEYTCSELKRKRFDFAILKDNRIIRFIEYDGEQHFLSNRGTWDKDDSLQQRQQRDREKNHYALSQNIPLVRIPYWERDNITLDLIMGDKYLIKE